MVVYVDQLLRQDIALLSGDDEVVLRMVNSQTLSAAARAALEHILSLRSDEAARRGTVSALQQQLADIERDEERIRQNLNAVSAADALHGRLTRALEADETRIDQVNQSLAQAVAAADKAHAALTGAIATLRI